MDAEIKKKIIELTLAVYRVAEKFPENEILKERIKERSVDLAAKLTSFAVFNREHEEIERRHLFTDFEVLKAYFGIAKAWNWIDPGNFDVLEEEYQKLLDRASGMLPRYFQTERPQRYSDNYAKIKSGNGESDFAASSALRDREKSIVDCLKVNGVMKVGDLANIFSGVNKRTLRRDIEKLCRLGILERLGKHAETAYKLQDVNQGAISAGQP